MLGYTRWKSIFDAILRSRSPSLAILVSTLQYEISDRISEDTCDNRHIKTIKMFHMMSSVIVGHLTCKKTPINFLGILTLTSDMTTYISNRRVHATTGGFERTLKPYDGPKGCYQ